MIGGKENAIPFRERLLSIRCLRASQQGIATPLTAARKKKDL